MGYAAVNHVHDQFRASRTIQIEDADALAAPEQAMDADELASLLLNPIALGDLAFLIEEALTDYWLERLSEVGRQMIQEEVTVRKTMEKLAGPKGAFAPGFAE